MLRQYEPVETVGSPDQAAAAATLPVYAAVASLSAISVKDDAAYGNGAAATAETIAKSQQQQRKRNKVRARFNDLARGRKWRHCQKVLFLLGVIGAALLASFVALRVIRTDEFNSVIEWIQVGYMRRLYMWVTCSVG